MPPEPPAQPREDVAITIGDVTGISEGSRQTGSVRGNYFGYWQNVEIKRSVDRYSTVRFEAPFEPSRREFRDTFRPFTFQRLECLINLETAVTGFMLGVNPSFDPNSRVIEVTGYAKPAVFHKCMVPPDELGKGILFNGQSLRAIAERLGNAFGIKCDFQHDDATPFKKCKLEIDKQIQPFLVDLAKQRNCVLNDTPAGDLRFWQGAEPGRPVGALIEGTAPFTKAEASFNPEDYFSQVTGFGKKKRGRKESRWTALNHWLVAPLRPFTFKLEDSERADVPEATLRKMGGMFADMASWTIPDLPGWRAPNGEIWEPNTTLIVHAPSTMIYQPYELLIREVTLKQTKDADTASLNVVMPGAFSGKIPEFLPWDESDS